MITKREGEGEENEQNVLTQTSNSPSVVPNKSSDIWSCVFHVYFSQSADSHSVSGLHQCDSSFSQHKLGGHCKLGNTLFAFSYFGLWWIYLRLINKTLQKSLTTSPDFLKRHLYISFV